MVLNSFYLIAALGLCKSTSLSIIILENVQSIAMWSQIWNEVSSNQRALTTKKDNC